MGIKKTIKRAIDTFGDVSSPTRMNSDDKTTCATHTDEGYGEICNADYRGGGNFTSPSRTNNQLPKQTTPSSKPMLGDRVLSEALLTDILVMSPLKGSNDDKRKDLTGSDDSGWEPVTDIEASGELASGGQAGAAGGQDRSRVVSLPSRDSDMRPLSRAFEDEIGQWALPSIPKRTGPLKKEGFKQGITRCVCYFFVIS